MTPVKGPRLGLLLGTLTPPEEIPRMSRLAESLGFDELWFAEDYFYTGGFSTASAALASTEHIAVGTGIVSALVRHPAVLAMEIASVARMFPGRFRPGIALGHPPAMRKIGLYPRSPLSAVRDCMTTVRALLNGEDVVCSSETFNLDGVRLAHPVPGGLALFQGGMGPKMLQLAGEIADGVIVPLMAAPTYVTWVREQMALGASRVSRDKAPSSVTVFVFLATDESAGKARESVRRTVSFYLHEISKVEALPDAYGITGDLNTIASQGVDAMSDELERSWPDHLMAVGNAADCARQIEMYHRAGAESVVLYPMPAEDMEKSMRLVFDQIAPLLR